MFTLLVVSGTIIGAANLSDVTHMEKIQGLNRELRTLGVPFQ